MSKSSSNNATESKRRPCEPADHETSKAEEQSNYYYDDATGYEIYKDDEEDDAEKLQNRER